MSDEGSEIDFDAFPQTLELLEVVAPATLAYVSGGHRVFVPSIEFWNTRTTIRRVWPVQPDVGNVEDRPWVSPVVTDQDGVEYGMRGASGSGSGHWEYALHTTPIPTSVERLTIRDEYGTLDIVVRQADS